MNKFIAMTALALILSASAAQAEYTGGGAMAPSGGITAPAKTTMSISGPTVDDAKQAVKQRWQDFKGKHAEDLEKLEAARRARWHSAKTDTAAPAATDGSDDGGNWDGSSNAAETPYDGGDGEVRPSKWETFKANHPDTREAIKEGAESAKGNLGVAKDEIKGRLHEFGEKHHQNVEDTKAHYRDWKENHQETIDAVKDHAAEWKENHQDTISAAKDRVQEWKGNHQDQIEAAKGKWQDWKDRHAKQ
ncbi:MAG: hypothetical protein ACAH83_11735 [Alphaproteobacteria bacterium]